MIPSLGVACLLVVASIVLGTGVLRILRIARRDAFAQLNLSFALGFGVLANVYMTLGFLQLVHPILLWAIPGVIVLCGIPFFRALLSCLAEGSWTAGKIIREQPLWSAIGIGFVFLYLCRGLLPPTGIDELMYHLSVPQLYLDHGGFYRVFFNPQANLVMLTEMNYLPILATGNATGCKFLGFVIGLQLTVAIGLLARDFFGFRTALPSMVLFLSLTNTMANFSTCDVDFTMALFALLGFSAIFGFAEKRPWALGVLLLGFCVQSKGIGFFSVVAIAAAGFITKPKQWKAWSACALVAGLFGAPWLIKSLVYANPHTVSVLARTGIAGAAAGEPVTMLLAKIFGFCADLAGRIAAAPWSLSLLPGRHRMDTIGPLFLVLIPLLFFQRPKRPGVGPFLIFTGAYVSCVSFFEMTAWGDASIRYYSPVLALLCPVAAFAWAHGSALHKPIRLLTGALISITIILNLAICAKRYRQDVMAVLTLRPQHEYLLAASPEYPVMDYANRHLSQKDTIMTTTCFGTYYLRIPYYCAFKKYEDRDSLMTGLKDLGVKYMLENDVLSEGPMGPPADYLRPVFAKGSFRLSKVVEP